MTTRHLLSDLIEEHLKSAASRGLRPSTLRNRDQHLKKFVAEVGNIQIRNVAPRHVDLFFERRMADKLQASSLNHNLDSLKAFFKWAERARYIAPGTNPVLDRAKFKVMPKARLRIPAADFPRLLDCASHPRDRMIVALGLFLFLRQSEIANLKIGDVDLERGAVFVRVEKSHKADEMPVSRELDGELRRWLTFYAQQVPLKDSFHLCPAKGTVTAVYDHVTKRFGAERDLLAAKLKPETKMQLVHEPVQRALEAAGYATRDDSGASLREGSHTLRRSGARALYDKLAEDGHDGAIRVVQAMLHHTSITQTEKYLGIELDQARRDRLLKGRRMFAAPAENVIQLVKEG